MTLRGEKTPDAAQTVCYVLNRVKNDIWRLKPHQRQQNQATLSEKSNITQYPNGQICGKKNPRRRKNNRG